jgi:hypothetical protein
MPCECSTFSATRICSSRLAPEGEPDPPLACHVLEVNCRPPANPLPVLIDQFPPDSHCAIASQFTLYARIGGGGGASGPGGGGTLGSKPAGAGGGGASGPGGGGTLGSKPAGAGGGGASGPGGGGGASGPGGGATFGSKPAGAAGASGAGAGGGASALALAEGAVTSDPVMAARMSVLRTLFNVFLSRCARAKANPLGWV